MRSKDGVPARGWRIWERPPEDPDPVQSAAHRFFLRLGLVFFLLRFFLLLFHEHDLFQVVAVERQQTLFSCHKQVFSAQFKGVCLACIDKLEQCPSDCRCKRLCAFGKSVKTTLSWFTSLSSFLNMAAKTGEPAARRALWAWNSSPSTTRTTSLCS